MITLHVQVLQKHKVLLCDLIVAAPVNSEHHF